MATAASAEATLRAAFAALDAKDWTAFVALVAPEELQAFKESQLEDMRRHLADGPPTGGALHTYLESFYGTADATVLEAWPADQVLRRWLAPRHLTNMVRADHDPAVHHRQLIGVLEERADLAHGLYRLVLTARYGPTRLRRETMEVLSTRFQANVWRLLLNDEITSGGIITTSEEAAG
jgi:hypothetical protein